MTMLRDEEIDAIGFGIVGRGYASADDIRQIARAVEQATYEAAIKAIEATKIDEDDLVEEIDREVNRTIDGCVDAIRSLMEQPK